MSSQSLNANYLNHCTIIHQGRPVCIGINSGNRYQYQIMNFDSDKENKEGWTPARYLTFPDYEPDESVYVWLDEHPDFAAVMNFRYQTAPIAGIFPSSTVLKVVSDDRHIYVFRPSDSDTLYVDRFVLNIETMELERPWEVRYQVSGEKYKAYDDNDTLSYYDPHSETYFYEPTTELLTINNITDGDFTISLTSTSIQGEYRWNIFAKGREEGQIEWTSFRKSNGFSFDVNDQTLTQVEEDGSLTTVNIVGYDQSYLQLEEGLSISQLASSLYSCRETFDLDNDATETLKTEVRLMLAFNVNDSDGLGVLDLGIGKDGTFATPEGTIALASIESGEVISTATTPPNNLTYSAQFLDFVQTTKTTSIYESVDGYVHVMFVDESKNLCCEVLFDTLHNYWANKSTLEDFPSERDWRDDVVIINKNQLKNSDQNFVAGPYALSAWRNNEVLVRPLTVPYFFLFDRGSDKAVIYNIADTGLIDGETAITTWGNNYDIMFPFEVEDQLFLCAFDKGKKTVHIKLFGHAGEIPSNENTDTHNFEDSGYQFVFPYKYKDKTYLCFYDNGDRKKAVVFKVSNEGKLDKVSTSTQWANKYDFMFPFQVGNQSYICAYQKGSSHQIRIIPASTELNDKDSTDTHTFEDDGYGFAFPYIYEDKTYLCFYDNGDRKKAVVFRVSSNGELTKVSTSGQWANKYDVMFPFQAGSNTYVCAYQSGSSHEMRIIPVSTELSDKDYISKHNFADTYDNVVPYTIAGTSFIVLNDRGAKTAMFFKINPDGTNEKLGTKGLSEAFDYFLPYYVDTTVSAAPQIVEYGNLLTNEEGEATGGLMMRCMTFLTKTKGTCGSIRSFAELDATFVGNNGINDLLLGFIEGAPPVPSENMTNEAIDYAGTTKVKLEDATSENKVWASSRDLGIDASVEGTYKSWKTTVETSYSWLATSSKSSGSTTTKNYEMSLTGKYDDDIQQFTPKNRGLAVVLSTVAETYALRLKDNAKTIVGYQNIIQEDFNNISLVPFKINPNYINNGDLNSYEHNGEAIDITTGINRNQKALEAYYEQYSADAFNSLPSMDQISQTGIANYYNWAEGAFYSEQQEYVGSSSESVGGAFNLKVMSGYSGSDPAGGNIWSLEALIGGHVNLVVTKEEESSYSLKLTDEIESLNLDHNDLQAGQVDAYSWYTFYQDPDLKFFDSLFNEIIDPEWLADSNPQDEDVQTLKNLLPQRKAVWRIAHRVDELQLISEEGTTKVVSCISKVGDLSMFSAKTSFLLKRKGINSLYQLLKTYQHWLHSNTAENPKQAFLENGLKVGEHKTTIGKEIVSFISAMEKKWSQTFQPKEKVLD